MPHIHTITNIRRPIEDVYTYVTTPANWPVWHPSSLSVSGDAAAHSGQCGEQVTEEFLVAGRRGSVVWTVTVREEPYVWTIDGRVEGDGEGTISYVLTPSETGTTFTRTFKYSMNNPLLRLLDALVLRRRIEAESNEALRRLKRVLEMKTTVLDV